MRCHAMSTYAAPPRCLRVAFRRAGVSHMVTQAAVIYGMAWNRPFRLYVFFVARDGVPAPCVLWLLGL
jgi:hypothetical protein